MPKQETVPKGLALLKGLSIFDPSEEFISGFRHRYWSQLDAFESDEKLLWIGAPDFRFFFVSFGNAQVYLVYAMALFLSIVAFSVRLFYAFS